MRRVAEGGGRLGAVRVGCVYPGLVVVSGGDRVREDVQHACGVARVVGWQLGEPVEQRDVAVEVEVAATGASGDAQRGENDEVGCVNKRVGTPDAWWARP
jgi:hypothetical protein